MSAETIAKALGGCKTGAGWMARCPAHDDRDPSLAISAVAVGWLESQIDEWVEARAEA